MTAEQVGGSARNVAPEELSWLADDPAVETELRGGEPLSNGPAGVGLAYITSRDLSIQVYRDAEAAGGLGWANALPEERAAYVVDRIVHIAGTVDSLARVGYVGPDAIARYHEDEAASWRAADGRTRGPDVASRRPSAPRSVSSDSGGIDAADLLALDLPPLQWVVPGVIPEGTAILASPPKVGKSCLVYQVVVEVAIGGELLGRRVTPGSALYLALEDGRRRGQERLRAALGGRTMPRGRLEVRWSAKRIGEGLEEDVAAWLDAHPDAVVVAIDTLGRVRPRSSGKRNAYEVDVEDLGRLQALFRDRQVALIIVHHSRKDSAGDDFLASVSGTYGITGSVDTIIALRRKRLEAFGSILVTGRDVADAEIDVRFDGLTWQAAPASLASASFERTEVFTVIEAEGPIFPAAIAERTGLGRTSIQNMVGKLVEQGAVARTAKGYVAVASLARGRAAIPPDDSDDLESHWSHGGHTRAGDGPDDLDPPPCPDQATYLAHRDDHYRSGAGWGCRACEAAA